MSIYAPNIFETTILFEGSMIQSSNVEVAITDYKRRNAESIIRYLALLRERIYRIVTIGSEKNCVIKLPPIERI